YLPKGNLHEALGKPPLDPAKATEEVEKLARAIHYAHTHDPKIKVIHRDLKPANVLRAENDDLKITDFGLVRLLGDKGAGRAQYGPKSRTDRYAAPEQKAGEEQDISPQTDVYALCVI